MSRVGARLAPPARPPVRQQPAPLTLPAPPARPAPLPPEQKGYMLHDRPVRAAEVGVVRAEEGEGSAVADDQQSGV